MPHINLPEGIPGIRGLLNAYPETGQLIARFTQQLMRGNSSLTFAERELIAATVSNANDCKFCTRSHASTAEHLFPGEEGRLVKKVVYESDLSELTEKMKALIELALTVKKGGKKVSSTQVENARRSGANEKAIHDTVLIAAAFSMFNRYVDGLAAFTPEDESTYELIGERLATKGY